MGSLFRQQSFIDGFDRTYQRGDLVQHPIGDSADSMVCNSDSALLASALLSSA